MQVRTTGTAYSRNCISVYTNLVTKSQSHTKSHDFYTKQVFHWMRSVVVMRILWRVCGCFDMKLRGKQRKNFRTVYNLLSHRNTALSSDIVLKLILWLDQSFIDGSLLLTLHTSHKMLLCESVVGQELQNLLFLQGSSPRSLPFSYVLLHNSLKQLCWIRLMALQ